MTSGCANEAGGDVLRIVIPIVIKIKLRGKKEQ